MQAGPLEARAGEPERDLAIDVRKALRTLRQRWMLVLLCVLLTGGAAVVFSLLQRPVYTASAALLFRDPQLDQRLFGSSFLAQQADPTREAATNLELVTIQTVAQRTSAALRGRISAALVSDEISVSSKGQSDVAGINATDPDPNFAAQLANTFARQYLAFRVRADRSKIAQAQQLVQRQYDRLDRKAQAGARGRAILDRAEQLRVFAALQTGNAEVVGTATVPRSASAPRTKRNVAIAVVLGLLLGVGLAFLFERLDRRVKDPDELEPLLGLPLLAAVPKSAALEGTKETPDGLPLMELETFRMLHARLRFFNVDRKLTSLLVTSAGPGDGKSTIALNLARAAAGGKQRRVLLLEADLRRPTLARQLRIRPHPGLSELLTDPSLTLEGIVHHIPVESASNGRPSGGASPGHTFDAVMAGSEPPNPLELLESNHMRDLLASLSDLYDLVVIDTPPTSVVSDAIPLLTQVDGVIIVTRVGLSTRDSAQGQAAQLRALSAPLLGVVANTVDSSDGFYGYAYGYAYTSADDISDKKRGFRVV